MPSSTEIEVGASILTLISRKVYKFFYDRSFKSKITNEIATITACLKKTTTEMANMAAQLKQLNLQFNDINNKLINEISRVDAHITTDEAVYDAIQSNLNNLNNSVTNISSTQSNMSERIDQIFQILINNEVTKAK